MKPEIEVSEELAKLIRDYAQQCWRAGAGNHQMTDGISETKSALVECIAVLEDKAWKYDELCK